MINWNENENDNGNIDHINKAYRTRSRHRDKYWKYSVSRLDNVYVISNIWATFEAKFIKKFSNTEAKLKKSVAYKKVCNRFFN